MRDLIGSSDIEAMREAEVIVELNRCKIVHFLGLIKVLVSFTPRTVIADLPDIFSSHISRIFSIFVEDRNDRLDQMKGPGIVKSSPMGQKNTFCIEVCRSSKRVCSINHAASIMDM